MVIKLAGVLLLVGGIVHAVPQIYAVLADVFGGLPVVQMIVGGASVVVGLLLIGK